MFRCWEYKPVVAIGPSFSVFDVHAHELELEHGDERDDYRKQDRLRAGKTELGVFKGVFVDQQADHGGAVVGAAAGHHKGVLEHLERADDAGDEQE